VLGLRFRVKRLGNWCFPPPITPPPPRGRGRIYSESPLPFGKGGEIKRGGWDKILFSFFNLHKIVKFYGIKIQIFAG